MANNVFANGREISCKAGDGKSICAFPDVCMTPPENPATPPGVPVPYPNTGMSSDTTSGSKSVKISGKEIMLKNKSYFKKSIGDEAGCAAKKGVVTSVNRGKVYFIAWSMDVKAEGENVVRHLDMTTHNHASPVPNAPPTVHCDSMAMSVPASCKTHVDNEKEACQGAKQIVDDKGNKAGVDCDSAKDPDECKKARACLLPPYNKSKQFCCSPDTTGHHVIPKAEFLAVGGEGALNADVEGYNPETAPCICAEGYSWHSRDSALPLRPLKKHGELHRAYNKARRSRGLNVGSDACYNDLRECGIEAVHTVAPTCAQPDGCTGDQLDAHHVERSKIPPTKPVCRVSDQRESAQHKPA